MAKFGKGKSAHVSEVAEDSDFETMYDKAFDTLNTQFGFSVYLDEGLKKEVYSSTTTLVSLELAESLTVILVIAHMI